MITVVAGIIARASAPRRILLTQRLPTKDFADTWECPGGKVEDGETPWQALRRELEEELGIVILVTDQKPVWEGEFSNPVARDERSNILLRFFRVQSFTGSPRPLEGQGLGWFTPSEMRGVRLAPGNLHAERHIVESLMNGT